MTLEQLYEQIEGDYAGTKERMMSYEVVERFVFRFKEDKVMPNLMEAIENEDIKESFECVHALKGMAMNMGFTKLAEVASRLTEQLRSQEICANQELWQMVLDEYNHIICAIDQFESEKDI